ncbi:hypothetical protein BJN34_03060 [Cupriavidus necator]|uniref:DUF5666 domain-containing protein n=1 Tax=Cupriavidus necator TaxID=106590 RepID=A0A1U9UKU9_CUPNE|nr:hypothetical protein [Cupriavidus necator]AQV92871.1 hypothetical protein BJN34_03060 [Cupriavidus necator]
MIRQSSSLLAAALAATAFAAAGSANAQRPPAPVGVAEEAVISGKIVDIDPNTKAVLVQGPRGNVVELVGGDEVRNFGQIRKGDILTVARGAAVVAALEPVDSNATALAESVDRTTRAAEGGKPGIMREITTTVTAQITKVDPAKHLITFRGPRETLRTVKVEDPAIDLKAIKQGQMAKIVYREVVAITVKAPAAAAAN